jgi:hypothetical protein
MLISMATGGMVQGVNASLHARSFLTGKLPMPEVKPMPALPFNGSDVKLNTEGMRTQLKDMPSSVERVSGSTLSLPKPEMKEVNFVGTKPATNVVYQGVDAQGMTRYVGITERAPGIRFGEHLNSVGTGKELLKYRVIDGATGLTRDQARIWEQSLINQYGLGRDGGLLLNKINSIAPKNWSQYGINY